MKFIVMNSTAFDQSFELSPFQKWAVKAITDGDHSLVTAHTGSGKTLPAEYAILRAAANGKRVIYTAPIKALSNTKLADLRSKYPDISFGLITGDITDNPEEALQQSVDPGFAARQVLESKVAAESEQV